MVSQLLFYTLLACQPKDPIVPPAVNKTPDKNPSPKTQEHTTTHTASENRTQASTDTSIDTVQQTRAKIVITEEVPKPAQSDPSQNFYAQEVRLGQIPYPVPSSEKDFCERICRTSFQKRGKTLNKISDCTLDLIETWEKYRKDFSYKYVSQTGNPVVGAVSCKGIVTYIKRGRMGLSHTQCGELGC